MMTKNWLSTKEVALALGVKPRTVTNMLNRGEIVGHKFGKLWKVAPRELERYLDSTSNIQIAPLAPDEQARFVIEQGDDDD